MISLHKNISLQQRGNVNQTGALFAVKGRESASDVTQIMWHSKDVQSNTQLGFSVPLFKCSDNYWHRWLQVDCRFALTHFSFHQYLNWKWISWTEAVFWKSSSYCFVFLRSRSLIDVCEHLVYKCLEYLIFVIKKWKNQLVWLNYCKGTTLGRLKGFIS